MLPKQKTPNFLDLNNSDFFESVYICFAVTLTVWGHFFSGCLALFFITWLDIQANACFFLSLSLSCCLFYIYLK